MTHPTEKEGRREEEWPEEPLSGPEVGSLLAEAGIAEAAEAPPGWKRLLRGPYGIVGSSVMFSLMNFLVKLASPHAPAGEITFARFAFGTAALGALGLSGHLEIRARNRRLLCARGVLGSIAILLLFAAIGSARLTNAILLSNMYVLFAAVFSYFALNEGFGLRVGLSLASALAGAALVLRPQLAGVQTGDLLALASAVFAGGAITVVRSIRRVGHESPWAILFYLSWVGTLGSLMLINKGWVMPNPATLCLFLLTGATGTLGQGMMTYAYRWCTTAEGGILSMLVVPFSAALGMIFLGDRLAGWDWVGAAMILSGCVWVVVGNRQKRISEA